MSESRSFEIGTQVSCQDGVCGDLTRVVVDPVARKVTHLVVEPKGRVGLARLVPVSLVAAAGIDVPTEEEIDTTVRLSCRSAEFDQLPDAEETQFLPGGDMEPGYASGQVLMWPYYGLGMGFGGGVFPAPVTYDRVPMGEVEVRRGDEVHASDGSIGRVQGLVIDPADRHVTHVLLEEGHLWGRKQVTIPISAVSAMDDGIHLTLSKEEVQALPDVTLAT